MRRPTLTGTLAVLALVVASAGSGYAAAQLPRNSVGTPQLKAKAVTAAKLKPGAVTTTRLGNAAVTGAKVRDGSLGIRDLAPGTVLTPVAASGRTLQGVVSMRYVPQASNPFILVADSFPQLLPEGVPALTLETLQAGAPTATCPGVGSASPGRLCVYVTTSSNMNLGSTTFTGAVNGNAAARRSGFSLEFFPATAANPGYVIAAWAYQVP